MVLSELPPRRANIATQVHVDTLPNLGPITESARLQHPHVVYRSSDHSAAGR